MKVYVASTLSNYMQVREIYTLLKNHNIEITFDWTDFAQDLIENQPTLTRSDLQLRGQLELKGVRDCDALLLVEPANKGSYAEFGYAMAFNKPIVILHDSSVIRPVSFHYLDNVFIHNSVEDALDRILKIANEP